MINIEKNKDLPISVKSEFYLVLKFFIVFNIMQYVINRKSSLNFVKRSSEADLPSLSFKIKIIF
jgi:hypothetical protein